MLGTIIPFDNKVMLKPDGVGLRNTIDLSGGTDGEGIMYALDNLIKWPLFNVGVFFLAVATLYFGYNLYKIKTGKSHAYSLPKAVSNVVASVAGLGFCSYMAFSPNLSANLEC